MSTVPRKKRVVVSIYDDHLNPYYAGGGPAVVQRIVESLADRYDVVVLTGGYPGARRSSRHNARYVPLPLGWAGPRAGQLLYTLVLMAVATFARYDLWVESFTPPFSSSFLPWVTRRPVLGVAQALSGREMARRYGSGLFLSLERRALRAYRDVVVLNDHDGEQVTASSPHCRVHLVPNVTPVVPPPSRDPVDGAYALFMGRIDFDQKGLGLLFEAYRLLGDDAPPLVIAGSGRAPDERRLALALETAGAGVRWVGFVDGAAKEELFAGAAFVVVPSLEESFCLVALEALARARPVVHFDLPQLSWIPADTGVVVPRFDTTLLAEGIRSMAHDPERRRVTGDRARAFAEAFLRDQPADAYGRLVDDLLAPEQVSCP